MDDVAVFLKNEPGALALMGETLAKAGLSIEGGGVWVIHGEGVGHFLFANGNAAKAALEAQGIIVGDVRKIVALKLKQDAPGQLGMLARKMADAGVNIAAQYSDHDNQLIIVTDNYEAAAHVAHTWMSERAEARM